MRRRPPGKFRKPRRKVCSFCVEKATSVDYKAVNKLRKFMTERGKMVPRRTSGTCAKHQRLLSEAIKRARQIALVAFVAE
jgi:small subunit ribosomal protein S18